MIFVDSNVPMYVVGAPHPHRERAVAVLHDAVARRDRIVTSAEVYQEMLHRYRALDRMVAADDAFRFLDDLVDEVFAIEITDVRTARMTLAEVDRLSSRDALHVAVMRREGVHRILSFDRGFDAVDDVTRLH